MEKQEKKSIIIIDDDANMLRLMNKCLAGYQVATAINKRVALKFLSKRQVDLILLDYEMPEQNGVELLKELRQKPETKHIPVIFMTGTDSVDVISEMKSMVPQGLLEKPLTKEKLLFAVERVIGR